MKLVLASGLRSSLKMTLLAVVVHITEGRTDGARAGVPRVARLASKTPRQATRDLTELAEMGILVPKSKRDKTGGTGRPNEYRFIASALPVHGVTEGTPDTHDEGALDIHVGGAPDTDDEGVAEHGESNPRHPCRGASSSVSEDPDTDVERSIPEQPRSTNRTPPPAVLAREPGRAGNYPVIFKIAREVLAQGHWIADGDRFEIGSEVDLVEAVKDRCAQLRVDYGRHDDVDPSVVHAAADAAWRLAELGRRLA